MLTKKKINKTNLKIYMYKYKNVLKTTWKLRGFVPVERKKN